jgi:hypothetical protein
VTAGHGVFGIATTSCVATSKMRELPLDLPEQKETYARICAKFIHLYKIPWGCVYNLDETNVHYVSFKKDRKGSDKRRSL